MYRRAPAAAARYRRKPAKKALAPMARRQVAEIAKSVVHRHIEDKHFYTDSTTTPYAFAAAGAIFPLSQIIVGQTDSTRIADQVRLKALVLRIHVSSTNATVGSFRFLVFAHKGLCSGSLPSVESPINASISQEFLTAMSPTDPRYFPAQGRLLKDEFNSCSSTNPTQITYTWYIPLRDMPQTYSGATYSTNALYLAAYGQSVSTAMPLYRYSAQLIFKDG